MQQAELLTYCLFSLFVHPEIALPGVLTILLRVQAKICFSFFIFFFFSLTERTGRFCSLNNLVYSELNSG